MLTGKDTAGVRTWSKTTVSDWEFFAAHPGTRASGTPVTAKDAPYADYGAEADFSLVDADLAREFDRETGHQRYSGTVSDVRKKIDAALDQIGKKWRPALEHVSAYGSGAWKSAAVARSGSLYESVAAGLEATTPQLASPDVQQKLTKLRATADKLAASGASSQADEVRQHLDEVESNMKDSWRQAKDGYLDALYQQAVGRYAQAVRLADSVSAKSTWLATASTRLSAFTDKLGEAKMKAYVESTPDPLDASKMLTYASGQYKR
jgi:hypothetical protein